MDIADKFELIKKSTQEIVTENELMGVLEKKNPVAYWGTAPTGRPHIGYFIPILKIGDFLKANFKFKVLIADLHAYLDDQKTPWALLDARAEYYKEIIIAMFDALKIKCDNIEFVTGSDFQLGTEYILDVLRMSAEVSINRAKRAAAEVVRFTEKPRVGSFIYPLMQIADIPALGVDVTYSGVDQRHIYMLGRELLPKLEHKIPSCVFTPMLPGLTGEKMGSSEEKSKIDLLDSKEKVIKKVNSAYCEAGKTDNSFLTFIQHVIFSLNDKFVVKRDKKFGRDLIYNKYSDVERDFVARKLHPMDLKSSVAEEINELLEPIRKRFKTKQKLIEKAYPE
ncbi:MAG: tyrosine--tRNA ligase [Nanoarchaeota archaeon]